MGHLPHRILHTMLRVGDLERSIAFYSRLGMRVVRRRDYERGRFTLVFLGFGSEDETTVLELTHNWDRSSYDTGTAYGHLALAVRDVRRVVTELEDDGVRVLRAPGPMAFDAREMIAFVQDPDGYSIELIERA